MCWTDHNGQVATCIRDDENCNGCKYMPEPEAKDKSHEYDVIKTHISEYACMKKQLHNLNRISYDLKDLAVSFTDILPRLKFVGFLTLTEHSSRALVRGISAPFVHIFIYVRSIIVKVLCLNATLPPYDQVSYKETKRICSTNSSVHITNILIVFKLFKRIDQTYVFGAIHPQPKGRGFLAPGS